MIVGFRSSFLMSWSMSFYCLFIVFLIVFLSFFQLFLFFTCHLNRSLAWPLRINFVIDTRCTAPFTHYYWLSRPTGFWLSKKEKESVISFGHKYEKFEHNKVVLKKSLKKYTNILLFPTKHLTGHAAHYAYHEVQQANVSTLACQMFGCPRKAGKKLAWSKLRKNFELARKNGKNARKWKKCT